MNFTYHTWGYPRPVGLVPKQCCCGTAEVGIDVEAIKEAVVNAITGIDICGSVEDKIDSAKTEIIEEVKHSCKCHQTDNVPCGIEIADDCCGNGTIDLHTMVGCCFCNN